MLVSPFLSIEYVQVAQIKKNTMTVDILISGKSLGQKKSIETTTLLDTGAGENSLIRISSKTRKIRWYLQDCLGYLDINQNIYNTDRLKIGFILSYMSDGKAVNWKEYYLDTLKDPNTGVPKFPSLVMFLVDV
jgi:hypothetical protein